MRIGIVTIPSAEETGAQVVEHVTAIARKVEEYGFHGLWVTDAFARGKPTLDPLILLGVLAGQTSRVELGTCANAVGNDCGVDGVMGCLCPGRIGRDRDFDWRSVSPGG